MLKTIETLSWTAADEQNPFRTGVLRLIDQTRLPEELVEIDCRTVDTVWDAVKRLAVRGAPAIGISAAYGVCVGLQTVFAEKEPSEAEFFARLDEVTRYLAASRPTAVNLFWALDRMKNRALPLRGQKPPIEIAQILLDEAKTIHEEDRRLCRKIGAYGSVLFASGANLLTHCNAGGLATADYGTALGVFFAAVESGKKIHVYADETRPLLQGARLTSWELVQREIPVTLLCDSMAAMVMRQGKIDAVFVGADRIAANGDTANKIGTYSVAVNARFHKIPFYVAAPFSTFDFTLADGSGIPIEERSPEEVRCFSSIPTAPSCVDVYNPAFDVTPAELITGIVTERGVISPVTPENIKKMHLGNDQ